MFILSKYNFNFNKTEKMLQDGKRNVRSVVK